MPNVTQIFSDLVVLFRNEQAAATNKDPEGEEFFKNERIGLEEALLNTPPRSNAEAIIILCAIKEAWDIVVPTGCEVALQNVIKFLRKSS